MTVCHVAFNNNNNNNLYYLEFRACKLRIFVICVFLRPKVFVRVVDLLKVFLGFKHWHFCCGWVELVWMVYSCQVSVLYLYLSLRGRHWYVKDPERVPLIVSYLFRVVIPLVTLFLSRRLFLSWWRFASWWRLWCAASWRSRSVLGSVLINSHVVSTSAP